jgi:hypothetical protein
VTDGKTIIAAAKRKARSLETIILDFGGRQRSEMVAQGLEPRTSAV